MSSLQRDLQNERDKTQRLSESVEQLRLELQMMGRLLAATREQLIASGSMTLPPNVSIRVQPRSAMTVRQGGRSKSDAKMLQRLQDELSAGKVQVRRLGEQVDNLSHKLAIVTSAKKEMLGLLTEMQEYIVAHR